MLVVNEKFVVFSFILMVWLSFDSFSVLLEGVHVYIEKLDFFWSFSLLYNIVRSLAALLIVRIVFRCLFMVSRSVFMVSCSDLGCEGLWFRSLNLCSISCVLISIDLLSSSLLVALARSMILFRSILSV